MSKKIPEIPIWEKSLLTIEEAAAYANIGINLMSELINVPGCPYVIRVGKRKRLVKRKKFDEYIENNEFLD